MPVALSFALAFTNWDLRLHNRFQNEPLRFIGLDHFVQLTTHPDFWRFLGNTLFLMMGIPLAIAGSLIAAILLSQDLRGGNRKVFGALVGGAVLLASVVMLTVVGAGGSAMLIVMSGLACGILLLGVLGGTTVYRTLFYVPHFTSGVAIFILWKKLYSPHTGPINAALAPLLDALGLQPPEWLTQYHWAKPALMIMSLWAAIGSNNMLLYLAGLSNVSPELHEAAEIDGASAWQKFWNVTWPQLAPVTFYIVVISVIGGLQGGFEMARAMTQGGPAGATTTLSYFIYTEGFETGRLGSASAIAWMMFLMVFVVTLGNWKFGSRYVND
ncbi:MAG: sugar ABC transporter permease [Verrucomicrobia bacterium]|nr:sugar ABC transporter permease [Verrucomicrobiota bacterium]